MDIGYPLVNNRIIKEEMVERTIIGESVIFGERGRSEDNVTKKEKRDFI